MTGSPPADRQRAPRSRSRSRSPPRRSQKSGGFRWKEKRTDTISYDDDDRDRKDRGGLDRGYRNRSPRRDNRDRDRDRPRDGDRARDGDSSRRRDDQYRPEPRRDTYGARDRDSGRNNRDRDGDRSRDSAPKKDKEKKTPRLAAPPPTSGGEEMIIVTVNDRLGTKAQIPCFASDKIKDLRVLVAARVGRKPHEILLKRQGERPFKDQLSLADYEVHNGAQLDLEVDTGD